MNKRECPNCSQSFEGELCSLACGHFCCPGCINPVCTVCNAPIQIALPIVAAHAGGQAFVGKFMGLPHPFSAKTYMTYPAKTKFVTPKHMRKRFKRGKKPEEVEEEEVNPDLFKYKVEDTSGSSKSEKGVKRNVFLGQAETSENKMPALAGAVRRSHYTTVMLVKSNNQFSCVYGDALKILTLRQAVNYKTLDIDQAEAARKRQFGWNGSEKFSKISDRLTSRPATGLEAREALSEDRSKSELEAKRFAKSTEADKPKVKQQKKTKEEDKEDSDEEDDEAENLDENGKQIASLMKEKKESDKAAGNESDSSDSFDENKLEDTSSDSESDTEQPPPAVVPQKKRGRDTDSSSSNSLDTKPKKVKAEEASQVPIEMQVETFVRQLFAKQNGWTIRDLAKSVQTEFHRLDKAVMKDLLAPILKNVCKYHDQGNGVKLLTLVGAPPPA